MERSDEQKKIQGVKAVWRLYHIITALCAQLESQCENLIDILRAVSVRVCECVLNVSVGVGVGVSVSVSVE